MGNQILVLGSLNIDFVVKVEVRPGEGETVFGTKFSVFPGGKGANQAVAASKLGGCVVMAGRIGDDVFSDVLLDSMNEAGVNLDYVITTFGVPTGSAFITVDGAGENSIVVIPGANDRCGKADVDALKSILGKTKTLMLQLEIPLQTVKYAIKIARSFEVKIMLDPAPPVLLPRNVLRDIDVITPNQHEASFLTNRKVFDIKSAELAATDLIKAGVKTVVIKLGAQGVVYAQKGKLGSISGHKVEAIDTTAAGDAFSGALAIALQEDRSIEDACKFANAAAALSVTRKGAQTSLPSRYQVIDFLKSQIANPF